MRWGAALAASTIDLFRDIDYLFFALWTGDDFTRSEMPPFVFFMIIWSPSHVYDLLVAVFVANLYHRHYRPSNG
jgi:hypothetical protein